MAVAPPDYSRALSRRFSRLVGTDTSVYEARSQASAVCLA